MSPPQILDRTPTGEPGPPPATSEADGTPVRLPFDNPYARLPERFFARVRPTPVPAPRLVQLNEGLAEQLGLDPDRLAGPEGVAVLAGNRVPDGAEPIALAYAGHQFGQFVPQLGDGRAILLGDGILMASNIFSPNAELAAALGAIAPAHQRRGGEELAGISRQLPTWSSPLPCSPAADMVA